MAILIEKLNKKIGRQAVLTDVNLRLEEGEVIGLLGPNGAGKSTLMKTIVGLLPPTSGNVQSLPAEEIGYLPEQNPLYEEMYIREYLRFMARIGRRGYTVEEVIEMTGLTPEINKKVGQLSKGYRQRVGLAAALLQNPRLLVLDEPTTGLDPNQLEDIRALIRRLGQDRMVILSTHILQEVREMCSRVVILSHGRVRLDSPITEIDNLEDAFHKLTTQE